MRENTIVLACSIFLLLLFALLARDEVTMAGNEATRFATVQALAEQNTFAIENTEFKTVDHLIVNGHVYSDKPFPLMAAQSVLYKVLALVSGINFHDNYHLSIYLMNLFGVSLLNVALFLLFLRRLSSDTAAPFKSRLLLSAGLVLTTQLLSYGVSLNNHTPAALLLFLLAMQLLDYPGRNSFPASFLTGITAGFLFDVEMPIGGLFGIGSFFVVALCSQGGRQAKLSLYSLGGVVPILLMGLINYFAIGQFLPQYVGTGGTFQTPYPGAHTPGYLFDILLGSRGFFSYMPALLFIVPALIVGWRRLGRAGLIVLATTLSAMLFYGLFTNEYGGWAYGFRYYVPLIPVFWYFIAREFASRWGTWAYGLLCAFMLWGLVTSYVGACNPWCNAFEGFKTSPEMVDYKVRSTFLGNLLYLGFKNDPDSPVFRFLVDKVYGPETSALFLREAFINAKELDQLAALARRLQERGSL